MKFKSLVESISIDAYIEKFVDSRNGDISSYLEGQCGDFALALGTLFNVKYCEIYTESFPGIHYFVEYKGHAYDVKGHHRSPDDVADDNEYYSQDYNDEEVKWKYVKATEVNANHSVVKQLSDELKN
jgi:hypothetical protein